MRLFGLGLLAVSSVVAAVGLGACGSFGAETPSGADAGSGTSRRDASAGAVQCPVGGAFGKGAPVSLTGDYSVEGARFSPDQTTAYLALCPVSPVDKKQCDLYTASFLTATQSFGNLVKMVGVSAAGTYDSYPTATPKGDFMLFASGRDGDVHVFVAAANNGSFESPTIARLAVEPLDFGNEPYLLADGKTLYFGAGNASDYRWDLYRASGEPPGFGPAEAVSGVADPSNANELAPVVTEDELEIFYGSDRAKPGDVDGKSLDILTATRASRDEPFGDVRRLDALSTGEGNDWPTWVSPDGCTLYYINKDASGRATLYVTKRSP